MLTKLLPLHAALAAATLAMPALAQVDIENAPDPYVHSATGSKLPMRLSAFTRTRVVKYDDAGDNVSAGYELRRKGEKAINATIYIYPAAPARSQSERERNCEVEFEGIVQAVEQHQDYSSARRELGFSEAPALSTGYKGKSLASRHRLRTAFGNAEQDVTSRSYLYCHVGGRWQIKYRITAIDYPEAEADIATLMQTIVWPPGLASDAP